MGLKHAFTNPKPEPADVTIIRPSNWNADHVFTPPLTGVLVDPIGNNTFTGIGATTAGQYLRRKRNQSAITYEFQNWAYILSSDYIFSQSIAQTLTAAVAATITCNPLPEGINANSVSKHYVTIIDAISGNEDVLVTAVVGSTFNCTPTLNHTAGNWTINSATVGIQEAVHAAAMDATVVIPAGTHTLKRKVFSGRPVRVIGMGRYNTVLSVVITNTNAFEFISTSGARFCKVSGMSLVPASGAFSVGACIYAQDFTDGSFTDLHFQSAYRGIDFYNNGIAGGNPVFYCDIVANGTTGISIYNRSSGSGQTAGIISNIVADGPGSATIQIDGTSAGYDISNIWSQTTAYGILLSGATRNVNEINITNCILDGPTVAGLYIIGQSIAAGTNGISISNTFIQHDAASYALIVQSTLKVKVNGIRCNNISSVASIVCNTASNCEFENVRITALPASTAALLFSVVGACTDVRINALILHAEATITQGLVFSAEAHANCQVANTKVNGTFTTPFVNSSTLPVRQYSNDWGTGPVTVASAATITIPAALSIGDMFIVSGVTSVTRILGGYPGARYLVQTTGIGSFTSGGVNPGNIDLTRATVAGGIYHLAYNATTGKWSVG